jgi:hypothetical protein
MNQEYDSYGFPKNNKVENRKDNIVKWLKIWFWLFLAFLILLKISLMIISGFISYNDFLIEPNIIMRMCKMISAILFSELYLGYKGLLRLNIL